MFIIGLGLYGSVHGPAEYTVNMQVILSSNQRVIAQHDSSFASDGTESIFRVMFKKPVEVQAAVHYTISACLKVSHYKVLGRWKILGLKWRFRKYLRKKLSNLFWKKIWSEE